MNKILEIIFRRNIKMDLDVNLFYKYIRFRDGFTLFELSVNSDFFIQNHNPKFRFSFIFCNFMIIDIDYSNSHHVDKQGIVDIDEV